MVQVEKAFRSLPCLMLINMQHARNYAVNSETHSNTHTQAKVRAIKRGQGKDEGARSRLTSRKWLKFDAVKPGQRVIKEPQSASNLCHSPPA